MRLALTVVSPTARQMADVVLDADPATPVAGIAVEFERFLLGAGAQVLQFPAGRVQGTLAMSAPAAYAEPQAVPLYVNYQLVPPHLKLAESPLRDGCVVSLGRPEGGLIPWSPRVRPPDRG
jgi:S-DNA-T family DNA segregation ATPase FtsK/SpoIIIE